MEDLHMLQRTMSNIVGTEWVSKQKSHITVRPRTSEEISKILKVANKLGAPVIPRGGGTGWWGSAQPKRGGILVDMTRMNEISIIDEDAMTVTVEAGITFSKLESKLHEKGYRVIILPESGNAATVGGHIETWGTSPYVSSVFEDQATQIVALKVIIPTGEIVQMGSGAIKTAAGNFARRFFPSDLTGLFIGAEGAFGIISEATLKMYEDSEFMITRFVGFKELTCALAVLRKIQREQRRGGLSTIIEQRLMSREALISTIPRLEGGLTEDSKVFLAIRSDGDVIDVEHHIAKACEISISERGRVVDDDVPEWWEGRFGLFPESTIGKGPRIMLVVIVPFGRFLKAADLTEKFGKEHDMKITMMGYPFAGPIMLAHAIIWCENSTLKAKEKALNLGRELMNDLIEVGCVPHRVGTDFLPIITAKLDHSYLELVKRIKHVLDPNKIMNPDVIIYK